VKAAFLDSLFKKYDDPANGGATVLIAQGGKVFAAKSYGIPPQAKYMPTTTVPQFPIGDLASVFTKLCDQIPDAPARGGANAAAPVNPDSAPPAARGAGRGRGNQPPLTPLQRCVNTKISTPVGMHKTNATAENQIMSNVDELYRLELGLENPRGFARDTTVKLDVAKGFTVDVRKGVPRMVAYGAEGGKKHAFVRSPDRKAVVIILTNDDAADAQALADRISDKLMAGKTK
jgi:CubicO group peptidase (beta-lactamase class C family)